jgi:outer membrane receptor protein involved in Fe transport
MNKPIYIAIVLILFSFSQSLKAQNNPLGDKDTLVLENERIEDVIDSDKPFIKLPYQELENPAKDNTSFESRDFYVETDFQPAPPEIMPYGDRDALKLYKNNLFRAGIGRFATPFARLYLNNGKDQKTNYGLELSHISAHQDGPIPLRRFRENYLKLNGGMIEDDYSFLANGNLVNRSYFNYAGTENMDNPEILADSLRMGFTQLNVDANLLTNYDPNRDYEYDVMAGIKLHNDRLGNNEFHFDLTPKGGYRVTPDVLAGADAQFTYIRGQIAGEGQNRIFAQITPNIKFDNGRLAIKGGINFGTFSNSVDTVSYSNIGPDVEISYEVVEDEVSVVLGYNSQVINNTYFDMISQNPYLDSSVVIKPSIERLNIYGGLKGNLGQKLDFAVRAYHKQVENQLIYDLGREDRYFNVLYDSLTRITGLHAELNYKLQDDFTAGAALNINGYNTSTVSHFYHVSPLRLDVYGTYVWDDKLTVKGEVFVFGPRPMGIDSVGEVVRQNAFVDVNLSGDYRITEGFSVFLAVNNLLNTQYQRWRGYLERRIDFNAGITLAF